MKLQQLRQINWFRMLGLVLLSPSLFSVYLFFRQYNSSYLDTLEPFNDSPGWIGRIEFDGAYQPTDMLGEPNGARVDGHGGGGGFSSPLPLYFGIMAIAGVLMINKTLEIQWPQRRGSDKNT